MDNRLRPAIHPTVQDDQYSQAAVPLAVGVLTIGVILAGKRWLPRWPAPLLAVVFAVALVQSMGLDGKGVGEVAHHASDLPEFIRTEFAGVTFHGAGNFHRDHLHPGQFLASGFCGGLPSTA